MVSGRRLCKGETPDEVNQALELQFDIVTQFHIYLHLLERRLKMGLSLNGKAKDEVRFNWS